jgi:integrase
MAYIRRMAKGWRAEVERKGVRDSRVFPTKRAAELWAIEREKAILDGASSKPRRTVASLIERYAAEVTPGKGSAKAEGLRLAAFLRDFPALAALDLSEFGAAEAAQWRDARLRKISPGSVRREGNTLRAVWSVAVKEWKWVSESPWREIRWPQENPARDRMVTWREARAILRRCAVTAQMPPITFTQQVGWAFLVGLRTSMRAGEILRLERSDIVGSVARVREHKTKHLTGKPRYVPLTPQGTRVLGWLSARARERGREQLFEVSGPTLDAMFRRITRELLIADLHFHDSRATAITHLARRVDPMTLAKISGHADLRILMSRYYRETEAQIAARLASPKHRA